MSHAILSPSSAERWLNCTPSARLEYNTGKETQSNAADEGTLAHFLGELILKKALNQIDEAGFKAQLAVVELHELYSEAMYEHAENYATFVQERYSEALSHTKDAKLFIEEKIDLSAYVPESYGTTDAIIIANKVLDLVDLKYGKGVRVECESNKQMMLYGLGALEKFDFMYDIKTVRLTIYQPRIDNISEWGISVKDLRKWGEKELKAKAKLAFAGEGEFVPGKHCQFCKVAGSCRANADFNQELAQYDFQDPAFLLPEEVAEIISRAGMFNNWLNAVEAHALDQAVNHGANWPGYKVVEGRSNRKYTREDQIAFTLVEKGFKAENIYKPAKILGITDLQKMIGKKLFEDVVTPFLIKPPGKPALVPLSDNRPEYNSTEAAKKDFENA